MLDYPEIGQVVGGKYRTVRLLGKGGMGIVLEAENVATGKRVALKWMHPEVSSDPIAAERLLREAQVAARVRHPNVIDVYDVDRHEGALFLVMEYLEGESLRVLLSRGGTPPAEILALLLGAMRGVMAAHRRGIVHRDIKPENIFLATSRDGGPPTPKLLDFGISKLAMLEAHQLRLTRTGMAFGTPVYMSYEQLCGAHDLDALTDVYSFGVILYEALTGHLPYEADSFPGMIAKIVTMPPPPMRRHRPYLPSALDRIVLAALSVDRDQRTRSVEALMRAVEPFVTEPALRASLGPALPARPEADDEVTSRRRSAAVAESAFPSRLQRQRHRRALGALAAFAVLLGAGAWALTWTDTVPRAAVGVEGERAPAAPPPAPTPLASSAGPDALTPEPSLAPTHVSEPALEPTPLVPLSPLDAGKRSLVRRPAADVRTDPARAESVSPSASPSVPAPASGPRRRVPTPRIDEF